MKTFFLYLSALLLLTGCSTTLSPAIKEYTILPHTISLDQKTSPSAFYVVRIATMKTLPSLASKNIYYVYEKGESGHYLYSRWSDAPSVLIERSLRSVLQEKNIVESLIPSSSSAQTDFILESDLNAFYHRFYDNGTSEGYIDITYRLVDTKAKHTIATKRFTITVPASSNDATGGVNALSEATRKLTDQCSQWLTIALKEKK